MLIHIAHNKVLGYNNKKHIKTMNITREQRDGGISIVKVVVGEADYGQAVEKQLRDYKRKANVPGFRPGMVPMGIVKKMYGKHVVAEQSYHLASNSVFEYLQKEGIDYVGDVIPSEEQGAFDFENNTEFEFVFEYGEAPKIELEWTAKDKVVYNKIKIDKKMRTDYRSNYLRRYGRLVEVDKVANDEALSVTLDNGDMRIEEAYVDKIPDCTTLGILHGPAPFLCHLLAPFLDHAGIHAVAVFTDHAISHIPCPLPVGADGGIDLHENIRQKRHPAKQAHTVRMRCLGVQRGK